MSYQQITASLDMVLLMDSFIILANFYYNDHVLIRVADQEGLMDQSSLNIS